MHGAPPRCSAEAGNYAGTLLFPQALPALWVLTLGVKEVDMMADSLTPRHVTPSQDVKIEHPGASSHILSSFLVQLASCVRSSGFACRSESHSRLRCAREVDVVLGPLLRTPERATWAKLQPEVRFCDVSASERQCCSKYISFSCVVVAFPLQASGRT